MTGISVIIADGNLNLRFFGLLLWEIVLELVRVEFFHLPGQWILLHAAQARCRQGF